MSSLPVAAVPLVMAAGDTILIPTGSKSHLFVAVYDAQLIGGTQKVLLVPFDTVVPKCDESCLLSVGEHTFINRPSFVGYSHSRSEMLNQISLCLAKGSYTQSHGAVSSDVLARIQAGYALTKRVPRHVKSEWP